MAVKTKKVFGYFPSSLNFGFVVKRLLNLKKCLKKRRGEFKNRNCFDQGAFYRKLANSGAKVQSRFYPGDLVTRTATGDREIRSVSGRVGMSALISSP